MPDLAQQIRDRLDEWARPSGEAPPAFTNFTDIDPEQAAVLQAEWDALMADSGPHKIVILPPSPFDLMRRAILAALDVHKPQPAGVHGKPHLMDCAVCLDVGPEWCDHVGYPCDTVVAIARGLGIEESDG